MKTEEKKEMLDRFRLYGEIFLATMEVVKDVNALDDFHIEEWELEELDIDCDFIIETDEGETGMFREIEFTDGMLWVGYGSNTSVCFFATKSESLQKVADVITKYLEA